jgi:hypothetical protein
VLESAKANGWNDVVLASKTLEIHTFRIEKITNVFIVDYVDEHGAPRHSTCSVTAGVPSWES